MYTDKIREAFERIGFSGDTEINQTKFNDILTKLMVASTLSSPHGQARPTTRMSPMNCGNRPPTAKHTSKLHKFAKPSTTASTSSRPSLRKSTVPPSQHSD